MNKLTPMSLVLRMFMTMSRKLEIAQNRNLPDDGNGPIHIYDSINNSIVFPHIGILYGTYYGVYIVLCRMLTSLLLMQDTFAFTMTTVE